MKWIYLALCDLIKNGDPSVKFIDMYDGQDQDSENYDSYSWPAVFIQFSEMNWQDGGSGVLEAANALVTIRICSLHAERATRGRNDVKMAAPALDHLARVDRLNKALHSTPIYAIVDGKQFCFGTDMQKGPQQQTVVQAGMKIDVVGYRTTLYDYSSSDWADVLDKTLNPDLTVAN